MRERFPPTLLAVVQLVLTRDGTAASALYSPASMIVESLRD